MNTLNHVAIIADGNGRWAEQRGLLRREGHEAGMHKIEDLLHWCVELHIPVLSVYVFSLENWSRPKEEVDALIELANYYFSRWPEFVENNVRVVVSGTRERLDTQTIGRIEQVQAETSNCTGLTLNLCANYGGRKEIVDAFAKGAKTEDEVSAALYQNLPEPDVIIRTGGFQRLSGFLLWQAAYSELFFTHTLFPDLSFGEFQQIKRRFEQETRKFGGIVVC